MLIILNNNFLKNLDHKKIIYDFTHNEIKNYNIQMIKNTIF
jgi:hypothetical protein